MQYRQVSFVSGCRARRFSRWPCSFCQIHKEIPKNAIDQFRNNVKFENLIGVYDLEKNKPHLEFISLAYQNAPKPVIKTLKILIEKDNKSSQYLRSMVME